MKILFHVKTLNYRGVTNSTIDYAYYNQTVLGNESVIAYDKNFDASQGLDIGSKEEVVNRVSSMFKVIPLQHFSHLNKIAENFDVVYTQKAGHTDDQMVYTTRHAVHAVFQYYQPHGTSYAYISEWLSKEIEKTVANKPIPFVPYVVNLPPLSSHARKTIRSSLGIPENAFVIGRLGGLMTFDIEFVNRMLPVVCDMFPNLYFLLPNTNQRYTHRQMVYCAPFFGVDKKSEFISACDAGIHGRTLGESFGLGICEFFYQRPCLSSHFEPNETSGQKIH